MLLPCLVVLVDDLGAGCTTLHLVKSQDGDNANLTRELLLSSLVRVAYTCDRHSLQVMRKVCIYEDQRKLRFSVQAAKMEDGREGCVVRL
jgi:hypothetical protein